MNVLSDGVWPAIAGAAVLFASVSLVEAASPAYCALYAREYMGQFTTGSKADEALASEYRIQDQAYFRCLNQDDAPAFPETSAYFGASAEDIINTLGIGNVGVPFEPLAQGDATADDTADVESAVPEVPVAVIPEPEPTPVPVETAAPAAPPAPTAEPAQQQAAGTAAPKSGVEPFSPRWIAWCKQHYPNSFDPETGMVSPFEGKPRLCPAGT